MEGYVPFWGSPTSPRHFSSKTNATSDFFYLFLQNFKCLENFLNFLWICSQTFAFDSFEFKVDWTKTIILLNFQCPKKNWKSWLMKFQINFFSRFSQFSFEIFHLNLIPNFEISFLFSTFAIFFQFFIYEFPIANFQKKIEIFDFFLFSNFIS